MGRSSSSSSSRMALWAILLAATSPLLVNAGDPKYGFEMFTKAGKAACWVEKLHKLPPIDTQGTSWANCDTNMNFKKGEYEDVVEGYENQVKKKGGKLDESMRKQIDGMVMQTMKQTLQTKLKLLPSAYQTCQTYLDNENQAAAKDYSSVLKDSSGGEYPLKGLAHCIIGKIESENGADGLADLQKNWANPKPFHQAILDRENENRANHGSPSLTLDPKLNEAAQKWADKMAADCKMDHIPDNHPDQIYNGKNTGENLGESTLPDEKEIFPSETDSGVNIANLWYTEMNDYPWPAFDGKNVDFELIGHFTQTVWKSSELVGYGVATRPGCNKRYVAARYFPSGNRVNSDGTFLGPFSENVLPPKK